MLIFQDELTTLFIFDESKCACCNASKSTLFKNGNEIELRLKLVPAVGSCFVDVS